MRLRIGYDQYMKTDREELAAKLYIASFNPKDLVDIPYPIRPLSECPQWQQDVWLRAADIATEHFTK